MTQEKRSGSPAKVAIASFIGTSVEYYDFFIYGTAAALVFPRIFFPDASPLMGTLLAFATFGVGFFARPVGGVVFGHFGDRIGRKKMLVISLVGMGLSTVLMGLLPSYASIGIAAPILLTLLRLIQGFCVGGEWGGAVLMAVEHAPKGKKGFFGAFPQMGAPAGTGLATFAFMLVAGMPDELFYSWGWRLPFLVSALLVLVGLIIRMKIDESPAFEKVRQHKQAVKMPAVEALRTHPREILLVAGIYLSQGVFAYISMSYFVSYGTSVMNIPRGEALQAVLVAAVVATVLYPVFGALSDRIGRKTTYMIGAAAMALSIGPALWLINTGNPLYFTFALVLIFGLAMSPAGGATGSLFSMIFSPQVRYSGTSIGYTLSQILGSAFAPLIASALYASYQSTLPLFAYMVGVSIISIVALMLVPGPWGRREAALQDATSDHPSKSASEAAVKSGQLGHVKA
ncbi:MFS transporter [Ochrobactrum sp. BTU2]|uniref:MFS transporter n=1 Tax=Ochrobactrum sp. BTU2 TaxID=2856166 RepID=UPI00211A51AF|nr:MFS transporter [Ochrobactrum sp. BTU2]MCQ9146165.1 MHS family MFS transporter [Ochrobactrum sp. BTU2]